MEDQERKISNIDRTIKDVLLFLEKVCFVATVIYAFLWKDRTIPYFHIWLISLVLTMCYYIIVVSIVYIEKEKDEKRR